MPGFYETIANQKKNGLLLAAWIIEGQASGARALFSQNERIFADEQFPAELSEKIRTTGSPKTGVAEKNGSYVFTEWISDGKRLLICGAGHVALCVIRIAAMLGYQITVIEDRVEFAEKAREAGAQHVVCRGFGEALDELHEDPLDAFVIMTREHSHDVECLRRILGKPFAYAGMMGSRSRTEQIRRQMLEEGYDAQKVERVHMPIGLPIGSRTPEEIAVSVMAELISVLNAADQGEGFPPGMAEELAELEKAGNRQDDQNSEAGQKDRLSVLAVITEKKGEAPRRPGTKMLIRNDGSFLGTVGGGYAEAEILQTAREMIREGVQRSRLVRISMKKGVMHCGGEITVLLIPV